MLHGASSKRVVKLHGLVGSDALLIYRALGAKPEVYVPSERPVAIY
jgi:hypothetical protein